MRRLTEYDLESYNKVTKKLFRNKQHSRINSEVINKLYKDGIELMQEIKSDWNCIRQSRKDGVYKIRRRRSNESYGKILREFLEIIEMNGIKLRDISNIDLYISDGESLAKSVGCLNKATAEVNILCGPIMIKDESDGDNTGIKCLNEFIVDRITTKMELTNIWANTTLPLIPGYAGYFNSYILDDAILFEDMYKVGSEEPRNWYFVIDKHMANKISQHLGKYREALGIKTPNAEEIIEHMSTYERMQFKFVVDEQFADGIMSLGSIID